MNTCTAMRYVRDHYAPIIEADSVETAHKMKMVVSAYVFAWTLSGPFENVESEQLYKEIEAVYNVMVDKLKG